MNNKKRTLMLAMILGITITASGCASAHATDDEKDSDYTTTSVVSNVKALADIKVKPESKLARSSETATTTSSTTKPAETTTTTTTKATTTTPETTSTSETTTTTIAPVTEVTTETTTVPTEAVTEAPTEQPIYEYSWSSDGEYWYFEPSGWVIDNQSYYVLCNCVANEAGSNWISTYNKALVCEVIFNRLNGWGYNSVYDVVSAPNQFTGSGNYVNLNEYSYKVNDDVISAVAFYCSYSEIFNEGYYYFTGDGYQNHFR